MFLCRSYLTLMILFCSTIAIGLEGISSAQPQPDDNWPQFRGTLANSRAEASGIPTTWSAQQNIVWRRELPGFGASSPVTFGDYIYLTCYTGYGLDASDPGEMEDLTRHLLCLSREDGSMVWNAAQLSTHPQQPYRQFIPLHGYASGTPAIDDSGIYVFYGTTGAAAYDFDGKQRWLVNCGTQHHMFGTSNSPVIFENLVIINAGVESGDLIALDKQTGAERWRRDGMVESWNTPVLVTTDEGKVELAVNTKGTVYGIDPATGAELWRCDGINDYICPSILAEGSMLYVLGGRQNTAMAIQPGGRGDVTESHVKWRIRKGSNVCSPVLIDDHLYWTSESKGVAYCVNAETGTIVYEQRLRPAPDKLYASPLAVDGKIFYVSRENGTYVVPAKPEFELLAHNTIEDDNSTFNGTPIISRGQMLLRSDKFLYCIGLR